jgi:hypothetical protein
VIFVLEGCSRCIRENITLRQGKTNSVRCKKEGQATKLGEKQYHIRGGFAHKSGPAASPTPPPILLPHKHEIKYFMYWNNSYRWVTYFGSVNHKGLPDGQGELKIGMTDRKKRKTKEFLSGTWLNGVLQGIDEKVEFKNDIHGFKGPSLKIGATIYCLSPKQNSI